MRHGDICIGNFFALYWLDGPCHQKNKRRFLSTFLFFAILFFAIFTLLIRFLHNLRRDSRPTANCSCRRANIYTSQKKIANRNSNKKWNLHLAGRNKDRTAGRKCITQFEWQSQNIHRRGPGINNIKYYKRVSPGTWQQIKRLHNNKRIDIKHQEIK